jgi:hypothetical protein
VDAHGSSMGQDMDNIVSQPLTCDGCQETIPVRALCYRVEFYQVGTSWGDSKVLNQRADGGLRFCEDCLSGDGVEETLGRTCPVTRRAHFFQPGDNSGAGMAPWVECVDCGLGGDL